MKKVAYQNLIDSVISSTIAAMLNDVTTLQTLVMEGVDMDMGDYDKRTPLHVASSSGNLEAVTYLLKFTQVNPSPIDRWGATPLNEAKPNVIGILKKYNAILGVPQPPYISVSSNLSNKDQFRLYYAAFKGDN